MNGMFFTVMDEDNCFLAYAKSSSGYHMVYRKLAASSATFFNYESDARHVMDICEKEYPDSTFTIKRFDF